MTYLGTFGLEFEKAIFISEISSLEFLKNESLTHTVIFGIGSGFYEGPWAGFYEGPGPGLLYKVCPFNRSEKCLVCLCLALNSMSGNP